MAPSTAASRSASSKTMKGALPPSSRESFLTVPAHWAMRIFPISVEPVKESLRTMGLEVSSAPISVAEPLTTLSTPRGRPARAASSASATAENGGALLGGFLAPCGEGAIGGFDGLAGFGAGEFWDGADDFASGGIVHFERLPRRCLDPLAVDVASFAEKPGVFELGSWALRFCGCRLHVQAPKF